MLKQEFRDLCDCVFKSFAFLKKGKNYYLDSGSDVVGSIHFQSSDYGRAFYLNCGFSLKKDNACLPFPKYSEVHMSWRIAVPGRERLANRPESYEYTTEMIKYALYGQAEMERYLRDAFAAWVMPTIRNGMSYILSHEEQY